LTVLPTSGAAPAAEIFMASPDAELLAAAATVEATVSLINSGIDEYPLLYERYGEAWRKAHVLRATTLDGLRAKARVAATVEFDDEELMGSIGHDLLALTA